MSEHVVGRWRTITERTTTPAPRSASLAWWGMVWVIATELTLFGVLISSYFWIRWQTDTGWPPAGVPDPKLLYPTLLTGAMAASALTAWAAERGVRRGRPGVLSAGLIGTLALGGAYFAFQTLDFLEKLKSFTPQDHAYGALVYTITGAHAAHAAVGMLLVAWVLLRAWRGTYTPARHVGVTVAALYWYFVVAVAFAVYGSVSLSPYL